MSNRIVIQVENEGRDKRQFVLDGGKLKTGMTLVIALVVVLLVSVSFATLRVSQRLGNGPTAEAENAVLRGRLQAIEARMTCAIGSGTCA